MDLFDQAQTGYSDLIPLAERLRPRKLDEVVGQEHLLSEGKMLRLAIETDQIPSMILWGYPGSGKTTLARLIAGYTGATFRSYSAVTSGTKEMKEVLLEAEQALKYHRKKTLLFIDEIHRFNKSQQDAFLPYVEQGKVILVGATTENPSFEVNAALLSRCRVLLLQPLQPAHLMLLLKRALALPERGLGHWNVSAEETAIMFIAENAHGDARVALNNLEFAARLAMKNQPAILTQSLAEEATQRKPLRYDQTGEEHYNLISALHKSIRGSDPDAAMYWLARMLEAGEDPRFLLRRMARMASEDIGLADPNALGMAVAAKEAFEFIGLPEGKLALAQLAVYLSMAPKSNALEIGYDQSKALIEQTGALEVPMHIRNAPTKLMKNIGYGKGYRYAHDYQDHWVPDDYLPSEIIDQRFFLPGILGWEGRMKGLLERRIKQRQEIRKNKNKN